MTVLLLPRTWRILKAHLNVNRVVACARVFISANIKRKEISRVFTIAKCAPELTVINWLLNQIITFNFCLFKLEIYLKRKNVLERVFAMSDSNDKRIAIRNYIETYVVCIDDECEKNISIFFREFMRRWNKAKRMKDRFLSANAEWLEEFLVLSSSSSLASGSTLNKGGRPSKEFVDSCNRSKRRKTENLRRTCGSSKFILIYHLWIYI